MRAQHPLPSPGAAGGARTGWILGALIVFAAVLLWANAALTVSSSASIAAADAAYPSTAERSVELDAGRQHRGRSSADAEGPTTPSADANSDALDIATADGPFPLVTIRVIDGTTCNPVPGARVAQMLRGFDWFALTDEDQLRVRRFGADHFALHSHYGVQHVADDVGELRVTVEDKLLLSAEDAGRCGRLYLDLRQLASTETCQLELWPDVSPRVRVTSDRGKPLADCSIGLRPIWTRDEPGHERRESLIAHAYATTDATGLAVLHHLQEWLSWYEAKGMPDRVGVRLLIAGVTEDDIQFDPSRPPEETIELTAPPVGQIELRLRDALGNPVGRYDELSVRLADDTGTHERKWPGRPAGPGPPQEVEFPADEAGVLHLRALLFVGDEVEDFHGFRPEQIGPAEGRVGPIPIEVDAAALTRAIAEMSR